MLREFRPESFNRIMRILVIAVTAVVLCVLSLNAASAETLQPTDNQGKTLKSVTSVSEAGAYLRSQMVNRVGHVELEIKTEDSAEGLLGQIWKQALKHTGKGSEGDYLAYSTKGYRGTYTCRQYGKINIVKLVYDIKYHTTAKQETYVSKKVKTTLSELKLEGMNDYQKVKAIYSWIIKNVKYDTSGSDILMHTAYGALYRGKAVCQGYSALYYRMCLEAGVDTRIISSKELRHVWNITKIDGKYYHSDAAWDSISKKTRYFLYGNLDFADHKNSDNELKTGKFGKTYKVAQYRYQAKAAN